LQNKYLNATDDTMNATPAPEKVQSSRDKFREDTFLVIIDTLISELSRRMLAYSNVSKQLSVCREYLSYNKNNIRSAAERLVAAY